MATARRVGAAALDLLLPPSCMACHARVAAPFQLCAACFAQCHFITPPFCAGCGTPFAHVAQRDQRGRCPACLEHTPAYGTARAALRYDTQSRPLLLQFKYNDRTELARLFAPMMLRAGQAVLDRADRLVPVPLHRSRLRQRGYNQAGLLCSALSRLCHVPVVLDALQRPRRTRPLGEYDFTGRADIMRNAVTHRPARAAEIAGARIVIIDDVMTSGATVDACARALLGAGAANVDVLVVARVPDPRLMP